MEIKKGLRFVIEGTDGSGKETQSFCLGERLYDEGIDYEIMSFPRYDTPWGKLVGECYLGKDLGLGTGPIFPDAVNLDSIEASLLYAGDRRGARDEILEINGIGKHIVFDRYVESNMGHQCGKLESREERDYLRNKIEMLEYGVLELPKPDLVMFLYMPFEISKKLKTGTREVKDAHESSDEHLMNAEKSYLELSDHYGWVRINCSEDGIEPRKIEEIHEEIYGYVKEMFNLKGFLKF
jgi:dTMP kinase